MTSPSNADRASGLGARILPFLALGLFCGACAAAAPTSEDPRPDGSAVVVDHGPWAAFLDRYVAVGPEGVHRVSYAAVSATDRESLDGYLQDLQAVPVSTLGRDQQMAFWINLYNALTVRVILDHYPVASIRDIDLTPPANGPWDAKLARVEGRTLSLNDVEHRILRPWGDPRIHYAVNCASISCPDLARKPFAAAGLDEQLDRAARAYVNHPRGARFDGDQLVVSSLYVWYREDFGDSDEGVVEHLEEYATGDLAERLAVYAGNLADEYDWRLNGPP